MILKHSKTKYLSLEARTARKGWIFISPVLAGILLLFLPMVYLSFTYIFYNIKPGLPAPVFTFTGFENLQTALFEDQFFVKNLITAIGGLLPDILMIIFFSLFVATILSGNIKGKGAFRMIMMIPVILATGVIERAEIGNLMSNAMMSQTAVDTGAALKGTSGLLSYDSVASLFLNAGVSINLADYVVSAVNDIYGIITRSGVQMLIFLAGLQSISAEVYEAAIVEGATAWERFWKITIPMVSPIIIVNIIYTIVDSFTRENNPVMQQITNKNIGVTQSLGVASAMSWVYFMIIAVILAAVFLIFGGIARSQNRSTGKYRY